MDDPEVILPPRKIRFTADFEIPASPFDDAFWISFVRGNLSCSFELAKLGRGGDTKIVPNIQLQ